LYLKKKFSNKLLKNKAFIL